MGEDVGGGVELHEALLEARHPAVQHVLRLLAAQSRGLASIGVGRSPIPRVRVECARNGRESVLGVRQPARKKGPVDRAASIGIPSGRHLGGRAAAEHLLPAAQAAVADDGGHDDRRHGERDRPPRAPALARRSQFVEQRIHGGKSVFAIRRKASCENGTQPARHAGPNARLTCGRAGILAIQRPSPEQRLEERDREAELVAELVDRSSSVLLG